MNTDLKELELNTMAAAAGGESLPTDSGIADPGKIRVTPSAPDGGIDPVLCVFP